VVADIEGVVVVPADEAASVVKAFAVTEQEKGRPDADVSAKESRFEVVWDRARAAMLARDVTVVEGFYARPSSVTE
jgi:hypothetical protein